MIQGFHIPYLRSGFRRSAFSSLLSLTVLCMTAPVFCQQQPRLARHVVSSAAVIGNGIRGTAGQPAIGRMLGTQVHGLIGFWFKGLAGTTASTPVPLRPSNLHVEVYPNPVHDRAIFLVDMPAAGSVRVTILDMAGRMVCSFHRTQHTEGRTRIAWDPISFSGAALPSGSYVVLVYAYEISGVLSNSATMQLHLTR